MGPRTSRALIICQLAHSRLRTRDTSIYRATNISIRVVFAKAVLDLFILGRGLHRPRGVVYHPRAAAYPVVLASVCIQGGFATPNIFLFTKIRKVKNKIFPEPMCVIIHSNQHDKKIHYLFRSIFFISLNKSLMYRKYILTVLLYF